MGLFLPALIRQVHASFVLPSATATIRSIPAVLKTLDLDARPNAAAILAGILEEAANISSLFGTRFLDVARPLLRDKKWSTGILNVVAAASKISQQMEGWWLELPFQVCVKLVWLQVRGGVEDAFLTYMMM